MKSNILIFIKKYSLLVLGLLMLFVLLFFTFIGPTLPFVAEGVEEIDYRWEGDIPVIPPFEPGEENIWGTDEFGRDLFSLLIVGAKETLFIIIMIAVVRYILAFPIGYLAYRRFLGMDLFLNSLNQFLSYVPSIIMVILFVTLPPILFTEYRPLYFILIIACAEVGRVVDMLKSELTELSQKNFIEGGRSVGVTPIRMFRKYYLPFMQNKLLISFISDIGRAMFLLGQLGFVGIFISQTIVQFNIGQFEIRNQSITWPVLLSESNRHLHSAIWIPFYATFAMTYVIFTFNIIAQGLQKVFYKKQHYV